MKRITLLTAMLCTLCLHAMAQPPVTAGLQLRLEAASGLTPIGGGLVRWSDLSGASNHVESVAAGTTPVYTANAAGSGFPGVTFDGTDDYLRRLASITTGFNSTTATLFVVRIGNTAANTIDSGTLANTRTTLSIGQNNSFENEFALMSNWAIHHSSSGNWIRRDHQCYRSLPNNLPAVTTAALNTSVAPASINYYVNGVQSTLNASIESSPVAYTAVSRSIAVGTRFSGGVPQGSTYFQGHILEVLAYNRLLTPAEIDDVNTYLKCKYQVNYASCNVAVNCTPPAHGCDDLCYWRVTGNNINNGLNTFGTLTNDDVEIQTNASNRGILTKAGLLGWNTMTPTAYLHVNCTGNNTGEGGLNSDIRFQNLEQGTGNVLTIDNNGYVYNSGIGIASGNNWSLLGNSITGQNFFGTTNGQDIRIRTWNAQRGVVLSGATATSFNSGFLGWNTTLPTARLHVNCNGGNEGAGISDIRFENLEPGDGSLLAIDDQGYVFNTGRKLPAKTGNSWDVTGNTITGGNHFFGTNSPDDVILRTSGIDKGILTSGTSGMPGDDGRLGWQTLNPTAHLHINCMGGNPPDGMMGSDVRFEELEGGEGTILVIDDRGYVYNSRLRLNPDGTIADKAMKKMYEDEKQKVQVLESELNTLKAKVDELVNCCSSTLKTDVSTAQADGSKLYQNNPNPFGTETTIAYYISQMNTAYIMLYDLNGKELSRYPISAKGSGHITVDGRNMVSGIYLYSLIIDGKEIDSKRMVFAR